MDSVYYEPVPDSPSFLQRWRFYSTNVSYGRGALDVRCSVEVKFFFTVTSSENLKFPSAVLRLVDDAGRKIPVGFGVL